MAQTVERDADAHRLRVRGQGADRGGTTTQVDIVLRAHPRPEGGTALHADAELYLSGRVAQLGRGPADDVGRRLFERFSALRAATRRLRTVHGRLINRRR